MAKADISFNSKKAEKFFKTLFDNSVDIKDSKKAYVSTISARVFKDIIEHFKKEQGPDAKWDAWSDLYAKRMSKIGKGGNNLLQDSGALRGSFRPSNYRAASNGIEWFNPAKTKGGFAYAAHHDEGRSSYKGNPRSFMWLSDKALDDISKITLGFLTGGV